MSSCKLSVEWLWRFGVAKRKKEKRKVCAEDENVGQVLWPRKLEVGHKTLATSLTPAWATSPAAASLALVSRVDKWAARAAGAIKKIAENYSCHAVKQKWPTEKCNKLWQRKAKQKASSRSPHSLETWSFFLPWIMASFFFFLFASLIMTVQRWAPKYCI